MTKRAGVERIASVFAADGGPKAAVEALEELLGGAIFGPTERARHTAG
jgi:hypothetical protein